MRIVQYICFFIYLFLLDFSQNYDSKNKEEKCSKYKCYITKLTSNIKLIIFLITISDWIYVEKMLRGNVNKFQVVMQNYTFGM